MSQNNQVIHTSETFEHARKFIEPILKDLKTHSWEDIKNGILKKRYHLLALKNTALVCEFLEYPRLKSLNIFLAGGSLEEIKTIFPHIKEWAKDCGAERIEMRGRLGFLKAFKNDIDSDNIHIQLTKDL